MTRGGTDLDLLHAGRRDRLIHATFASVVSSVSWRSAGRLRGRLQMETRSGHGITALSSNALMACVIRRKIQHGGNTNCAALPGNTPRPPRPPGSLSDIPMPVVTTEQRGLSLDHHRPPRCSTPSPPP
jgi:hypothetical protein